MGNKTKSTRNKPRPTANGIPERRMVSRRAADQEVIRREAWFRALIENSSDGITVLDADGSLCYESPSMSRMLGYEPDSTISKTSFELVHPDDMPNVTHSLSQLLQNPGVTVQLEIRVLHRDGSWRTLEVVARNLLEDPVVAGIVVNQRDITDRKQAEEALRESEQRYRLLADNAADVIWTMDMNLQYTYVSPSIKRQRGYSVEEAMKLTMQEILTPASLEIAMNAYSKALARENSGRKRPSRPLTAELELNCKDGSTIWTETTTDFLRDPDGQICGWLGVTRDISERKKAEGEKRKMEQQLQITGRLAAVGELTAGVAHELNNPLAAVQAYAELLSDKDDLDETTKSDVETIYKEAQRASRITSNLLSFARRYKPEKRLIFINEVVEKSLELHAYRMNVNNIDLVTELDPDLPMTMADFHQMQQVFVNIITNAEHTMTEAHGRGSLHVRTQIADETIQITFTDSGPGIPEDNLKRIFDPFFTTKDVGEGTGLGLSICYGIVQEHGGHLYARSKPGQGATFVVEIPVISEDHLIGE